MGRRPPAHAARSKQKAHLPESVNPSIGGAGIPPEGTNPQLGQAELQPVNTNQTLGEVEAQPITQASWGNLSLKRKGKYSSDVAVRRSARLQDVVVPLHGQEIDHVIEEVAVSESEKEDERPTNEETKANQSDPSMGMGETNLGKKIDRLVQLLEGKQITFEAELMSALMQASNRSLSSQVPSPAETTYRSLYFRSQRKVEALKDKNRQLATELEITKAKLEGYEKGTEAFEKVKDMFMVANLAHATLGTTNTMQDRGVASPVQTKKRSNARTK